MLVIGLTAGPAAAGDGPWAAAVPEITPTFRATMPDRFGIDGDADGILDMPNTARYVQGCPEGCRGPVRFTLRLNASESRASLVGRPLGITGYRWRVTGPDGLVAARWTETPLVEFRLPEGTYRVALDVQADLGWGTATSRVEQEVAVQDLLVVAIGDSYASGEGNPEQPRISPGEEARWGDAPADAGAEAAHAAAHRSTAAWPALVALALEDADPTTSVTFVSVATTGARVKGDLVASGSAGSTADQLTQVAQLVGERTIDLLFISAGGNDVGFPLVVRGLVDADPQADPVCYEVDLENVWRAATDGDWNRGSALRLGLPWGVTCRETRESGRPVLAGLAGLPAQLDELAEQIGDLLHVEQVYLMEYPDPTGGGEDGEGCPEIVGDLTAPFGVHEIDAGEQAAAKARVLGPLNRILDAAASAHGWSFVGGIADAFGVGHGYCAVMPHYPDADGETGAGLAVPSPSAFYRHPAQDDLRAFLDEPGLSWYRTAAESVLLQGPSARWETTGTLHPNELGQLAMASRVLGFMGVGRG